MTNNAPAGTRVLGSQRCTDGKAVVRIEDRYDAHLAGGERCDIKARWKELIPAYQDLAAQVSR